MNNLDTLLSRITDPKARKPNKMTNSSGSSQYDPELAIPDIFWDMETNSSYQAFGSERQIFSMSVNKTYNQKRFRYQQNNQSKQQIHEMWSFTYMAFPSTD